MTDQPGQHDEEYSDYTVLSDREEVRVWAEDNDVVPARWEGVGGADRTELVRRDELPDDHEERDWATFYREFENRNLAVVHETGPSRSSFQLVDRDDLDEAGDVDDEIVADLLEGDTDTAKPDPDPDHAPVTDRLMGWDVELPTGEQIGMVSDVDEEHDAIFVDEDPSLVDRIKASIQWSDEGDGPIITSDRILEVDHDAVVVERDETSL